MKSRRMRLLLTSAFAVALLAAVPTGAHAEDQLPANPADQPPFDGGRTYRLSIPPPQNQPPPGFRLDPQRVTAIATGSVGSELAGRAQRVRVRTRLGDDGQNQWQVDFFASGGNDIAEIVIDDPAGRVVERWTGAQ